MNSDTSSLVHIDRTVVRDFLRNFPTLTAAIFPKEASKSKKRVQLTRQSMRARDIATPNGDITLMELLQATSPFKLEKIFGDNQALRGIVRILYRY
jgi:hypothetical protein